LSRIRNLPFFNVSPVSNWAQRAATHDYNHVGLFLKLLHHHLGFFVAYVDPFLKHESHSIRMNFVRRFYASACGSPALRGIGVEVSFGDLASKAIPDTDEQDGFQSTPPNPKDVSHPQSSSALLCLELPPRFLSIYPPCPSPRSILCGLGVRQHLSRILPYLFRLS